MRWYRAFPRVQGRDQRGKKSKPAAHREGALPANGEVLRLEGDLQFEVDSYVVAQGEASSFNGSVPVDTIRGAVDHEAGGGAGLGLAIAVGGDSTELTLDDDRKSDATKREVALNGEVIAIDGEGGGSEIHGGELFDEEEVTRAEVVVAVFLVGVNRRNVNAGHDGRVLGVLGGNDGQVEGLKRATNLADGEVLYREGDLGVSGIDLPGAGDVVGVGFRKSSHRYMQAYGVPCYSRL